MDMMSMYTSEELTEMLNLRKQIEELQARYDAIAKKTAKHPATAPAAPPAAPTAAPVPVAPFTPAMPVPPAPVPQPMPAMQAMPVASPVPMMPAAQMPPAYAPMAPMAPQPVPMQPMAPQMPVAAMPQQIPQAYYAVPQQVPMQPQQMQSPSSPYAATLITAPQIPAPPPPQAQQPMPVADPRTKGGMMGRPAPKQSMGPAGKPGASPFFKAGVGPIAKPGPKTPQGQGVLKGMKQATINQNVSAVNYQTMREYAISVLTQIGKPLSFDALFDKMAGAGCPMPADKPKVVVRKVLCNSPDVFTVNNKGLYTLNENYVPPAPAAAVPAGQPEIPMQPQQPMQQPMAMPQQQVQPAPYAEPFAQPQPAQPVQPVQPIQPVQPVQPIQPVQQVQAPQPVQPVQPPKPVEQMKPIEHPVKKAEHHAPPVKHEEHAKHVIKAVKIGKTVPPPDPIMITLPMSKPPTVDTKPEAQPLRKSGPMPRSSDGTTEGSMTSSGQGSIRERATAAILAAGHPLSLDEVYERLRSDGFALPPQNPKEIIKTVLNNKAIFSVTDKGLYMPRTDTD